MIHYDDPTIELTKYELIDPLPNPFLFRDGSFVKTKEDWQRRRKEIYENVVNLQFGTMPPKPDFLTVEPLYLNDKAEPSCYKIHTGTKEKPIVFSMTVFKSKTKAKAPAVISGDFCFPMAYDKEFIQLFTDNGIDLVMFNRTELAPDIAGYNLERLTHPESGEYALGKKCLDALSSGSCIGQVKETYPENTFGTIGAWAWGYSRCVDALEVLGFTNMNLISFTGLSRGAKTAALAGVLDERALIVNPHATCCGGYSSYRIRMEAKTANGEILCGEPLSNIFEHFPSWLGPEMKKYIDNEAELPFDSHEFKAMIAPRILFVSEATGDISANPIGSWQTTEAAREVYRFLGCEENLLWYFRNGTHAQTIEDAAQLVNIILHIRDGVALNDKFFNIPFGNLEPAYKWKCPE